MKSDVYLSFPFFNTGDLQPESLPHEDTTRFANSAQFNSSVAFKSSFFPVSLEFSISETHLVSMSFIQTSPSIGTVSFFASSAFAISALVDFFSLFLLTDEFTSSLILDDRHGGKDKISKSFTTFISVVSGVILLLLVSVLIFLLWRSRKNEQSVDEARAQEIEVNDDGDGPLDIWDREVFPSLVRHSMVNPSADDTFTVSFSMVSEETWIPGFLNASD
jgi:cbb3-type cytochrome oxidase subunit 3